MVSNPEKGSVLSKPRKGGYRKPTPDKPRRLAWEIFSQVIRHEGYSNILLNQKLNQSGLDERDRAFITELVYGSIRQIGRNDFLIQKFVDRPWQELDPGIIDILRLGAYQIFDMRIPDHAAVSATVDLARIVLGESKASFVNAILRRLSENSLADLLKEVSDDSAESLAIRYSHPTWIINAYKDHIGDITELKKLLETNNKAVAPTLVAWPGKSTVSDLVELGATPTQYSEFGAVLEGIPNELELIRHRKVGVQDEGSQLIASIFANAARDHEPWLDLCAGPGGKAALLSYLARSNFYANEISETRANLVKQVVNSNTLVFNEDGRNLNNSSKVKSLNIRAILADVPCTGLGALRRRPEVRWRRNANDLKNLSVLQSQLVESAVELLPMGGILGYATCSPHFAETVAQCADFERKLPIEKIDIANYLPERLQDAVKNGYLQLWPHRHQTDAMFLALYRKK